MMTFYIAESEPDCDGWTTSIWRVRAGSLRLAFARLRDAGVSRAVEASGEFHELSAEAVEEFHSYARPYISNRWCDHTPNVSHRSSWGVPR